MDSKKSLDSALDSALEPDLIVSADSRVLSMSEEEQKRRLVAGYGLLVDLIFSRLSRGH